MMIFALYAQHGLLLEPCPLCIFQRVAVMALGVIFLVAALHAPVTAATYIYAVLIGLAAMGGAGVAGRHVWLQNLPPDKVPACGPGLDFMLDAFPLAEVLQMVLSGSGECAEVSWSLLGLSMPAWLLVAFAGLGFAGVLVNCVRQRNP
jgi:disulfide bond formation protein DsbB